MKKLACLAIVLAGCSSSAVGSGTADSTSGGSATGTATTSSTLHAISAGRTWRYVSGDCTSSASIGAQTSVHGKLAFPQDSTRVCPDKTLTLHAYVHFDGDRVEVWDDTTSAWLLASDTPVEAGHTWTTGILSYVWEQVGTTTVPAGTFDDCWASHATATGVDERFTFCRGIGLVRSEVTSDGSPKVESELSGTSF
jgi:hypothetical protein